MMTRWILSLVVCCALASTKQAATNPLAKVIQLLDGLTAKMVADGEAEAQAYKAYFEWCDDAVANLKFEIKTSNSQKDKLEATIAKAGSDIEDGTAKIEELIAAIAEDDASLQKQTAIRGKEAADFGTAEAELMDTIDTIDRAVSILEREMQKNPAALVQVDAAHLTGLVEALGAVVNAAAFSNSDRKKLLALVQSQVQSQQGDDDSGAPAAETYKSHSTNILDVLEDLKAKADAQLSDARKAETNAKHNFDMLKQSLDDCMAADTKNMSEEKADKAAAEETKAVAEGDLTQTVKGLQDAETSLDTAGTTCMQTATDHEATVKGRTEELAAIAEAKKILSSTTTGAEGQTYSFLQLSTASQSSAKQVDMEVLRMVKSLAKQHHSTALTQLANRIAAAAQLSSGSGGDVFAKVKNLIQEMLAKLSAEATSEATEKAYCDTEMGKTEEKKGELESDVAKLTSKIDQASARSARLKSEVHELQAQLAALAKQQAEMGAARQAEHVDYVQAKTDLEQGLQGVRGAISVLRDYYGTTPDDTGMLQQDVASLMQQPALPDKHEKSVGSGHGIISILEVVESDFATNLASEETAESDAQSEYDKVTQENKITQATKEQDVKYKTQESNSLDKNVAELSSDRRTTGEELEAVLEYYSKLKDRCIAKPETYEERQRRRSAEIAGLKEALAVLEGESVFMQRVK